MSRTAARDAARLAVTPRWLGLAAIALLFIVLAILLGRWQWDRTQQILASERAAQSQPVALDSLFPVDGAALPDVPGEMVGQPVTLAGEYDPSMQVAVVNRELQGSPGVWIVTGLRLADGRVAAVLRGWSASADDATTTVPSGPVSISGILQPNEPFYADAASAVGTAASISSDRLAAAWKADVLPGYTTLTMQEPPREAAPSPVPPTVETRDVPFPLQNFVYAFQWWLFALFALAIYLRWLVLEARERPHAGDGPSTTVAS